MFFVQNHFSFLRQAGGRRLLAPSLLAALLLAAAPQPLRAGTTCPPCSSSDPNACAFSCCLFMNCDSPASASCVASCALGWFIWEVFGDGELGPAFKSVPGQTNADCQGDHKVGVISLPPTDSRNTTKRVEIGLVSIADRKFHVLPEEVSNMWVEVASMEEFKATNGKPRWRTIGAASYDTRAGAWVVNWNLLGDTQPEYVLKARVIRKSGRAQEARAVALTPVTVY